MGGPETKQTFAQFGATYSRCLCYVSGKICMTLSTIRSWQVKDFQQVKGSNISGNCSKITRFHSPWVGSAPLPEIGGIWGGIWRALLEPSYPLACDVQ